jgi:HlyD family secretion protein
VKRRFSWIALLGVAALGVGWVSRSPTDEALVLQGEIKLSMLGRAIVEPADGVSAVRAEVSGRVSRVAVRVGDRVRKGDVLAELDSSSLEIEVARRRAEARAFSSAKRSVAEGARPEERAMAEAELAAATAELDYADKRASRMSGLLASGSVSASDAEVDARERLLAAARVASAKARLRLASGGGRASEVVAADARVEAAEAALRQAQSELGKTRLIAPIDGVVLVRKLNVGDTVKAGGPPAFELADVARVEVRVEIGEDEDGVLTPGLPTALYRSGKQLVARGRIGRVAPQLEPRSVGFDEARLRGDARVRVAWITLDKPAPESLVIGQVLEAEIARPPRRVDGRLPREAIRVRDGHAVVSVRWGPLERERPVTVGVADETHVEVIGLAPGTAVLVAR